MMADAVRPISILRIGELEMQARPDADGKIVFRVYEGDRLYFLLREDNARAFADFVMSVPRSR